MSQFGFGYFGGYMGGYGMPVATEAYGAVTVKEDAKVKAIDPIPRQMNWLGLGGSGSFPGFDKSPPLSIPLIWLMRNYDVIALAQAITVRPLLAGTQTIEIEDDRDQKDLAAEMVDAATKQVLPFIRKAMEPCFEDLHFGCWLQEVVWDFVDGAMVPCEPRSILPGEATIFRDEFRRFSGYQIGNEFRDTRYALLTVNNPHIDPIFGESRDKPCVSPWWRSIQSELNADKTEQKASGIQIVLHMTMGETFIGEDGKTLLPQQVAQTYQNAAVQGKCITVPRTPFTKEDIVSNPALADIDAVKVQLLDHGNNGPALMAHLSRITALDAKIMMARMRPTREAMEGSNGTKAEAGVHGQIGTTDTECLGARWMGQISAQVLDRWRVTNYGPNAPKLIAKQSPLSDPQQQFLQQVYQAIVAGTNPDPESLAQIDRRALGKRIEIPLRTEEEVTADLAKQEADAKAQDAQKVAAMKQGAVNGNPQNQQGGAPNGNGNGNPARTKAMNGGGGGARLKLSGDVELADRLKGYLSDFYEEDDSLELSADLEGGEWKTIDGAHVYIKDGVAVAGPKHLLGKTSEGVESHGKAPAKDKAGYHAIERDAKGAYKGTRGDDGKITHVQAHADRLQKTKAQPGHTDVYLSKDPNADAPVVGTDSKGRQQAPRSEAATQRAKGEKFSRNEEFHKALPAIRERLEADLGGKNSEEAAVLSLIDKTGFRIGGDEDTGAKVKAYGASTLNSSHVKIEGDRIEFNFTGKKGVQQNHVIHDAKLAKILGPRVEKGGDLFDTSDSKTGDYLKKITGNDEFKNKDFRTEVGTETARAAIEKMPVPTTIAELKASRKSVSEVSAKKLGNNPSEAQKSYINQNVYKQWHSTVAAKEQAKMIVAHAAATGLSENDAARDFVAKGHAAAYREKFNKAVAV